MRILAATGIAAVACEIAALALFGSAIPDPTATRDLASFAREHEGGLRAYSLLAGLVSVFLLAYAVVLPRRLREAGGNAELALVASAGGMAQAILHWVASAILLMLPLAASLASDIDLRMAVAWISADLSFLAYPAIPFAGASGVLILQTRLLPAWTGWLGIAVAAAETVTVFGASLATSGPLASSEAFGTISFTAWLLWVLATSISLTLVIRRHVTQS